MKLEIGQWEFPTKGKVTEVIREILHAHHDRELAGDELAFALALLDRHPNRVTKIGAGVKSIQVVQNPDFPTTWCFWLTRVDGSNTDFSFLECLRPSTHKQKVVASLRDAVHEQIKTFKLGFFITRDVKVCPLSGVQMRPDTAHVDHADPQFATLADQFIGLEGGYDAVPIAEGGAGQAGSRLASREQEARWKEYHARHAVLRVVDGKANLRRKRT